MPLLRRVTGLWNALARRARLERDLNDEVADYVERRTAENVNAGLSHEAARRAALVEIGGTEQVKESVRDARAGVSFEQLHQDLAHGARMLHKSLGFTTLAVTTLALGIGANTAIFSVVDTVVFRPLPYKDPNRLVRIVVERTVDMSLPDVRDIREEAKAFETIAADDGMGFTVTHGSGLQEGVLGAWVTIDWLPTLGVQPIVGRTFSPEEGRPGRNHVIILSNAYWRRRFRSDPSVIGQVVRIDGAPSTIIGVLPPNILRYGADFLTPLVVDQYPQARDHRDLDVFARLKPDVTRSQAQADVDGIARRLQREYPSTNAGVSFGVRPLGKSYALINSNADRGLLLILGAVGLVLLIACANVANLLLARSVGRYHECVVRAALGAGRGRLIRQMLVENVLLFVIGGVVGLLFAHWSVDSLVALAVAGGYLPERLAVEIDARVFGFCLAVSLATGVGVGLVPAVRASRVEPSEALRAARTSSGDLRQRRASRLLIAGELALSMVLLVGFGLIMRSLTHLYAASGGFNRENLLITFSDGGRSFPEAVQFWRKALDRTRLDPGVRSAAVSSRPPVHGARQKAFAIEGHAGGAAEPPRAGDILISADYFDTMGIRILKGRAFTERDNETGAPVVIISETLARRHFGPDNPLGRRVHLDERSPMTCCVAAAPVEGVWREIVGVAADVRQANLDEPPALTIYRPFSQIVEHDMYLMIRARSPADADRLAVTLRPALVAVDTSKEWLEVRHMDEVIDSSESIRLRRFVLILLGGFAALALLLAAVGTYGVMTCAVAERTREIGIRVALGATRSAVFRQVLGDTAKLTAAGVLAGALAAWILTRFIETLLFGVTATDAATYAGVAALLMVVALAASYFPARRATRVDPIVALRNE